MVVRRRAKGRAERPPVEVRRRLDFGSYQKPLRRALLVGHVDVRDVDAPRDGEGRGRRPEQRDLEVALIELRDDVAAARLRQARHLHIRKVEPAARARDLEGLGLAEVAEADDLRRRRRRECPEQAAPHGLPMGAVLCSLALGQPLSARKWASSRPRPDAWSRERLATPCSQSNGLFALHRILPHKFLCGIIRNLPARGLSGLRLERSRLGKQC